MKNTLKRLGEALIVVCLLAVFVGGLTIATAVNTPPPHVPYRDVKLPAGVIAVTSRSWFRPALWSFETFATFQKRPAELKWLVPTSEGVRLDTVMPMVTARRVLVLVHGYNAYEGKVGTYFADVLDLLHEAVGLDGTIVIYDWPSTARHWEELTHSERRSLLDPGGGTRSTIVPAAPLNWESRAYRTDVGAARGHGADGLAALLERLGQQDGRSISIVAHSMGSLVTLEALARVRDPKVTAHTVVLLAPDLPADVFEDPRLSVGSRKVGQIDVVYSRNDQALLYSKVANVGPRLGRDGVRGAPPLNVRMHDVTNLLGDGLAVHNRFLEADGAKRIGLGAFLQR